MPKPAQKKPKFPKYVFVIFMLGLGVAILLLSKIINWMYPPPAVPLLPDAPGLQAFTTIGAAQAQGAEIHPPTDVLGDQLYSVGVYTETSSTFPAGTVDLLYSKNDARQFEVLRLPVPASDPLVAKLILGAASPSVVIGSVSGTFYQVNRPNPVCLEATPTRPIRVCQINTRLVFEAGGATYILTGDGLALTNDQLLEIARSIQP